MNIEEAINHVINRYNTLTMDDSEHVFYSENGIMPKDPSKTTFLTCNNLTKEALSLVQHTSAKK